MGLKVNLNVGGVCIACMYIYMYVRIAVEQGYRIHERQGGTETQRAT